MLPGSTEKTDEVEAPVVFGSLAGDRYDPGRFVDFIMFTERSFLLNLSKELEHGDISFAQFFLLGYLAKEDHLTLADIVEKMGHSAAAAASLVDGLEKLGYVQRLLEPDQSRPVIIKACPKGLKFVETKRADIIESLVDSMDTFSAEDERAVLGAHGKLVQGDEGDLLAAITAGPSKEFWHTYRSFKDRAERSELSDEEASQLASMATKIEEADADRLSAAARLAEIRGVPFDDLVKQFEIGMAAH